MTVCRRCFCPLSPLEVVIEEWDLNESDLKRYPHFDSHISPIEAKSLATDPRKVKSHTFYPFMLYEQRWTRFSPKGQIGKPKSRPIRYAARRDAYIFSYYRYLLSQRYEAEIRRLGLSENILAYRHIPVSSGFGGKCNIHFAHEAFLKIQEIGNCCAIVLDISSYFEHLDHSQLKRLWCRLLGVEKLPPDHFKVFQAITKYAVVDKQKVYERLGFFGEKRKAKNGRPINGYLKPYNEIPSRLCTGKEFQEKIARQGTQKSIIKINYKSYGIPQGAPISDLLANLYLIDFDKIVAENIHSKGGEYYRYSDDILLIVPGNGDEGCGVLEWMSGLIKQYGSKLEIKPEKSSVFLFENATKNQRCTLLNGKKGRNGIEYLGFRYDGKAVYLRDSTISNLYRKVTRAARRDSIELARRYPDKNVSELKLKFNYERLIKRFGRVEGFYKGQRNYITWTFWTYAKRASDIFGKLGHPIIKQLRNHKTNIHHKADKELERAVFKRDEQKIAQGIKKIRPH